MFKRPDGSSIPISVRFNPIFEKESSSILGMMLVLDDITAEKKMEEFLKHRQRIETMGQISATIAHEIRNPLASIRGAVQEIGRAIEIPESKKVLLDIVLSESDRLDQIITDFLKFARMRPPRLAQADMGRVLSDVKLLLGARAEARDVAITLEGDEGEPFPADPEQLRQLFLNLGVNALQAMHGQAKKQLTIRVKVISLYAAAEFAMDQVMERPDRPGVLIELQDTGHGMSDKVRRQIFEPFFTTKTAGTGLGLAIVERIVQSHEGVVSVESKEGHGTTIRVWLPTDLKVGASISGLRQATI
jgi:two-component system sensor histidine kinase PilS (NtrC family)